MTNPRFEIGTSILNGDTADVYFHRTISILQAEGINPEVTMEFFPRSKGILCGITEATTLLSKVLPESGREVWALREGDEVNRKEVALRIRALYCSFGLYETALCGILSSGTAWATAARECVKAAGAIPVISFGARHLHPNVAANLDYAAVVGGCKSGSTILGARIANVVPAGTMPHALILVIGDTLKAVQAFDRHMPHDVPRIALVDTFKDEAEESVDVARGMRGRLNGVRLDTPSERGGVTPDLVKEVRTRLDMTDFKSVEIFVSGGITPERIKAFIEAGAPVDGFGVGSYISSAPSNDFTADIHEVEGRPIAKRGRIPGVTPNPRLVRVL